MIDFDIRIVLRSECPLKSIIIAEFIIKKANSMYNCNLKYKDVDLKYTYFFTNFTYL